MPTENSGILPTPTPTGTLTVTPDLSATPEACSQPPGWFTYVVQPGNTLFSIARASGSTVVELRNVNCIFDVNQIVVGDVLFIPREIVAPVRTGVAQVTPGGMVGGGRVGCVSPSVQIISPMPAQRVTGQLTVTGTADWTRFQYYKLEIRADGASIYNFLLQQTTPVTASALGTIDTTMFQPGNYWLRLVVVDTTGNVPRDATCVIPMVIE